MPSPLASALALITTDWEALTPPDRTDVLYARVDGPDTYEGGSGDRVFWFEIAGGDAQAERGSAMTEYEHFVTAKVRLESGAYNRTDFEARIVNEAILLMRAVDVRPEPWGSGSSGIVNLVTVGYSTSPRTKDATVLSLRLRAYIQET